MFKKWQESQDIGERREFKVKDEFKCGIKF